MNARFARITKATGVVDLPLGTVVEVAYYERGFVMGFGLDKQIIGIKVNLGGDRFATLHNGLFVYVPAAEAKAWRAAQKRQRSRDRRGLA